MNVLSQKTFHSSSNELKDVRDQIRDICEKQNINKTITENIILAVNEACMNIIQHGYENDPKNEFSVLVAIADNDNKKELVIKLIDHAKKIDPSKIKSRELDDIKPGGIGVHIIHKLMDSAVYLDDEKNTGNILELRKII
ncbi:MAG: ATP-binding protein [Gammaproteobacteria bacterium]